MYSVYYYFRSIFSSFGIQILFKILYLNSISVHYIQLIILNAFARGETLQIFWHITDAEMRVLQDADSEDFVIVHSTIIGWSTHMTDGWTDR